MTEVFSFRQQGNIGILTINNPPVNATSHAVRTAIYNIIEQTDEHEEIKAVILTGAGRGFIAGADIREFGLPPVPPILGDIVLKLQDARKPWIAAIHGNALGGGLEIALGCHYRLATSDAKMGFPEVHLGLIPGAGGTALLPRCVPMADAIKMITSGKPIDAIHAQKIGLITQIVTGDLEKEALAFAQERIDNALPRPLKKLPILAPISPDDAAMQLKRLKSKNRGQKSPIVAFETLLNGSQLPFEKAINLERKNFLELKQGPQSTALRHIFFAERSTAKLDELKSVAPCPLDIVGIVGGGTMGAGIAAACLLAGLDVVMLETDRKSAATGTARVDDILTASVKHGIISHNRFEVLKTRFQARTDYGALSNADLVIEAVFEDMEVKQQVFQKLDKATRPDAILATNTSYLDVNEIASSIKEPGRVLGLHFFSPAHIMKLVEIIRAEKTTKTALATGFALAKILGKIPVVSGVCDGFIGNRIMSAYRREADYLLEDGATPDEIDNAMREFGFPMGIFEMQDLAGLDISWAMRKRQAVTRATDERYVRIADRLCELGRLGKKTGAGWYNYRAAPPFIDDQLKTIINEERRAKSIKTRAFSSDEIMRRILDVMQQEAMKILNENIARSGDDIDVVMTSGYGFPRWRGGPIFMKKNG